MLTDEERKVLDEAIRRWEEFGGSVLDELVPAVERVIVAREEVPWSNLWMAAQHTLSAFAGHLVPTWDQRNALHGLNKAYQQVSERDWCVCDGHDCGTFPEFCTCCQTGGDPA